VITDQSEDTADWFFSHAWLVEGMSAEDWESLLDTWTDGQVFAPAEVRNYRQVVRTVTYVRTLPLLDRTPRVTLLVAIREESLENLFAAITAIPGTSVFITSAKGRLLTSVSDDPRLVSRVTARSWPAGHMEVVADAAGHPFFAFRTTSAHEEWSYTAVIPAGLVMAGPNAIKYATAGLFLLTLAAGVALAGAQARRSYRPIEGIVERLSAEAGQPAKADNEYAFIERTVDRIVSSAHDLERKVEWYQPMALHSFFIRLLYNVMEADQLAAAARTMGISVSADAWTVAVLYRDRPGRAGPTEKASQWIMAGNRALYLVQVDPARLAVVMNATERQDIERAIGAVAQSLGPGAGARGVAGVGGACAGLEDLHRSFREAQAALSHRVFRRGADEGATSFFEDIGGGEGAEIVLPAAREEELLNRTRGGDFGPVQSVLESLFTHNAPALSSTITMHCFFYDLLSTALKAAEGTELTVAELVDERRIMALAGAQEMKDHLSSIFRRICAATASRREGRAVRARADMLGFIDENCLDRDISLRVIAGRFGVSVPYLSRFIKEQTGESFVEYVARRRIARAKQMLAAGASTIEQVSRTVGYDNPLTFRRAFRKYEGVNPGDYRGTVARAVPPASRPSPRGKSPS
jgi:AraC-like DNA-binding protein